MSRGAADLLPLAFHAAKRRLISPQRGRRGRRLRPLRALCGDYFAIRLAAAARRHLYRLAVLFLMMPRFAALSICCQNTDSMRLDPLPVFTTRALRSTSPAAPPLILRCRPWWPLPLKIDCSELLASILCFGNKHDPLRRH